LAARSDDSATRLEQSGGGKREEPTMHAIVVEVEIDSSRSAEAERLLKERVVPAARAVDGFVSGIWMRSEDGTQGRATVLFESEQAARAVQQDPPVPQVEGAPVKFVRAVLYEVLAQA
jgi:Antibiotic biosynthesis monooxygenase